MKQIDLNPRDYKSEPVKGESFMGANFWPIVVQFGSMFAVMALIRYFAR